MIAFIGNYVTDFCFVREFLEKEIIPVRGKNEKISNV